MPQPSYLKPILHSGPQPADALCLAGSTLWFREVEVLRRDGDAEIVSVLDLSPDALAAYTTARPAIAGLSMDRPHIMGIVNVTPDSFSDGGIHQGAAGITQALHMAETGVSILDIGGESTRPGADYVDVEEELARVLPVLNGIAGSGVLSIDTRKAEVARQAIAAGAAIFNDVTALTFDPASARVAAESDVAVCLMHSIKTPATMQDDPHYSDVLLDIYDALAQRIAAAEAAGIRRERLIVDPGIGFGKTLEHNLALIRGLALFHGLGCPILFGASRKRFIGTLTGVDEAQSRDPGSHAVLQMALDAGAQIIRVHDTDGALQVLRIWQAIHAGGSR
ncbi:dihydropteroate synthase [Pontivivens insulae]|uniref:Dihydropteroate synthase n=1 Tax=Pontivivens insulae TaxID=1639689 RepID=A0A2R8ACP6_9RHOB|nr:dihydropteroate synthase [Pontivivens insulae]RED13949.1 dihydropteroate synthase [Pontivivens insulae]SPF30023.1 Dihydropteroate synthase [Pontivivens insulae]